MVIVMHNNKKTDGAKCKLTCKITSDTVCCLLDKCNNSLILVCPFKSET